MADNGWPMPIPSSPADREEKFRLEVLELRARVERYLVTIRELDHKVEAMELERAEMMNAHQLRIDRLTSDAKSQAETIERLSTRLRHAEHLLELSCRENELLTGELTQIQLERIEYRKRMELLEGR